MREAVTVIETWYQEIFVETGRAPALWLLIGFLVTFVLTRQVTRRIRGAEARAAAGEPQGRSLLSNIHIGGVHVHHQVWGILLVLVVGLLHFRFAPESPWLEVLAALFGAGAALALDEFALWLHLDDVYWTEEGRKSIDAILVAATIGIALLMQASPVGVAPEQVGGAWLFVGVLAVHLCFVVTCFLKGKRHLGIIGAVVPVIAMISAVRLATPTSYWGMRFYSVTKRQRAQRRFSEEYSAKWDRFRDWVGGDHALHLPHRLEHTISDSISKATSSPTAKQGHEDVPGSGDKSPRNTTP